MTTICIVVGHKKSAQGATSIDGCFTEYNINKIVAHSLQDKLAHHQIQSVIIEGDKGLTEKVKLINSMENIDVCIELHCNAAGDVSANGTETLYWHRSTKGKRLATLLQTAIHRALCTKDRGLKAIAKGKNGWYFLGKTKPVACILEPFFLSHIEHKKILTTDFLHKYVDSIVSGLKSYYERV